MVFSRFHTTMTLDSRRKKGELSLFKGQGACKFGILSRILKILDSRATTPWSLDLSVLLFYIFIVSKGQGLAGFDSCPGY